MSLELLETARQLATAGGSKRPRQADLKRAISTAYYGLFHAIAQDIADLLVGTGQNRPNKAWTQIYRALDHGGAKQACQQLQKLGFPDGLCRCGDAFITLQKARHDADYDPDHRVTRADALIAIKEAEKAIDDLKKSRRKDRKAFAVHLLLKRR